MCERVDGVDRDWVSIGRSLQGRPILARRVHADGPRVLWIGGVHGDETEGRLITDGLLPALRTLDEQPAVDVLQVRVLNPDGTARRTRTNGRGVDLNRNFPTPDFDAAAGLHGNAPVSEPESRLLYDVVLAYRPDLVIAVHSARAGSFVNFDGPALEVALRWSEFSGVPVVPSDEMVEPTPGSFGTWAGRVLGIPMLTVELRKGMEASEALALGGPASVAVVSGAVRAAGPVVWPGDAPTCGAATS